MASPQTENGYTKIANELLEAIFRSGFSGMQIRVLLWVARNSYGWSMRKAKKRGLRQMAEELNAKHPSVHLAVQVLLDCRVLLRDDQGRLSLNKDYEQWRPGQPADQKSGQPTDQSGQPADQSGQPTDQSGQPADRFVVEPKERKERKESVKGVGGQNGDTNTPTLAEIVEYASELNKPMDCRRFFDHYSANGWTRGKARIQDWKAVVRLWENDGNAPSPSPPKKRCRCRRDSYFPEVLSRDGKTLICKSCRQHEDIEAGVL